ncbi:MAG: hypothetical protein IIC57_06075 [Proteobacteria bacterium]|nr:hypothetical protein [Pseudomonadota bacterium]
MTLFLRILAPTSLALFIMANALPMMASNTLAKTGRSVHVLLSEDDPPVHIGDGEGGIADIKKVLQKSNPPVPPDRYAWHFELREVPSKLFFTVTIFSLVHWSNWDCPTTAWLNGSRVYDLRDAIIGSRSTTIARFSVGKKHLRSGKNTIEIREENCDIDTLFPRLNDSLVKGVLYRF